MQGLQMCLHCWWHNRLRVTIQREHRLHCVGYGVAIGTFGKVLLDFSAERCVEFTVQKGGQLREHFLASLGNGR